MHAAEIHENVNWFVMFASNMVVINTMLSDVYL